MTTKSTAVAAIANDAIEETPMQQFESALAARYPGRLFKRFEMPTKVRQARAIYMMEITSRDEIDAAIYADSIMKPIEKQSMKLTMEAERRECVRASIIGIVTRTEPVTYKHVNNGHPFHEIDAWPTAASACLQTYFNDINGVPTSELLEGLKGARTIGGSAPPTSATPHGVVTAT